MAVILSAQCTDARVNKVTPALFSHYGTPRSMAQADPAHLERLIHSTGFFRSKARNLQGAARRIVTEHDGQVPKTMDALCALPGVARKTANVVLYNAFRRNEGIAVDTHVIRVANLLHLTRQADPNKIEKDLTAVVPEADWGDFTHLVIDHGRAICVARRPRCEQCFLNELCPSSRV